MIKKIFILMLPLLVCSFNRPVEMHDYHVATLYLENTDSELQISLSIFTDDLERRFKQLNEISLFLGDPELECEDADQRIEEYLRKTLGLQRDDQEIQWTYLGKEVEYEICWIYLEAPPISEAGTMRVDLRVLFDLFADQTNVINWKDGDKKERGLQRAQDGPVKFERHE